MYASYATLYEDKSHILNMYLISIEDILNDNRYPWNTEIFL